jgi:hypothetical protein
MVDRHACPLAIRPARHPAGYRFVAGRVLEPGTAVTVRVLVARMMLSGRCGLFSGGRRADSRLPSRLCGLTGKASVARRRPRTFGVT